MATAATVPLTNPPQGDGGVLTKQSQCDEARLHMPAPASQPITLLILGINGFIGHHLCRRILETTNYNIRGIDIASHRITSLVDNSLYESRFSFRLGGIEENWEWIESQIQECDVVLPLAAIATPASYVEQPLRVFELDFEVNLRVIRLVVKHNKRLIFPSTSEVYGMCRDEQFNPELSELVCGPIKKTRWIYSCSKQLLDRVIYAYGQEGLDFTIFRPFNWFGPGLDDVNSAKAGSSRVTTQFLGHIARGEDITLVDGGSQRRTFTYIDDGLDALMIIIMNQNNVAGGKIYNIGNPTNNYSIRELATLMLSVAKSKGKFVESAAKVQLRDCSSSEYYGQGYEDVKNRTPDITATTADLGWQPVISMERALNQLLQS
ncbi:hypothetical protein NLG97_g3965 [Lecanicillium saksenae]|uniref:Uncharacterized protein n=1 Tax=Lecanicillium saksenae TaxID=468837 RepID=A0ACC1QY06_9HYPO|nr:hypothetical protein NLG97_g3965 [Lecanicillium saksenae]